MVGDIIGLPTCHAGWVVYIKIRNVFCDFQLETAVMLRAKLQEEVVRGEDEEEMGIEVDR